MPTTESTTILVALIAAIPPTAAAVAALVVALRGAKTADAVKSQLGELHVQINGHMLNLLKQTGAASHAEGRAEGVEAERTRPVATNGSADTK